METVSFTVRTNTKRGKYLLGLLREMAKTGRDIEFQPIPNDEKQKAMKEAKEGKSVKPNDFDELLAPLNLKFML